MMKYTLLVLAVVGSAATAIASIAPRTTEAFHPANVTVIAKNQAFPHFGPLIIEECAVEDCSEE